MNNNSLPLAAVLVLAAAMASGCASSQTTAPEPAEPTPAESTAEAAPAPAAEPAAPVLEEQAPVEPAPAVAADSRYEVVAGDSLWAIAAQSGIYGDPYYWPLIYKANHGLIEDADLIYPGQVLIINRNASSAEMLDAAEHARTRGPWSLGVVEASDRAYLNR
jgi:nucleoid-associated protein YgaU